MTTILCIDDDAGLLGMYKVVLEGRGLALLPEAFSISAKGRKVQSLTWLNLERYKGRRPGVVDRKQLNPCWPSGLERGDTRQRVKFRMPHNSRGRRS